MILGFFKRPSLLINYIISSLELDEEVPIIIMYEYNSKQQLMQNIIKGATNNNYLPIKSIIIILFIIIITDTSWYYVRDELVLNHTPGTP